MTSRELSGPPSGQRRRVRRVRAELHTVVARDRGDKISAQVTDVSTGGMFVSAETTPDYGERVTVVVRFDDGQDWLLLPATVRWLTRGGFGVEFESLDSDQRQALSEFIDRAA